MIGFATIGNSTYVNNYELTKLMSKSDEAQTADNWEADKHESAKNQLNSRY